MKFTSLLKSVILEQSRFEVLFNALTKPSKDKEGIKSKPKLTKQEFIQLVTADPTTRLNNNSVKYATTFSSRSAQHPANSTFQKKTSIKFHQLKIRLRRKTNQRRLTFSRKENSLRRFYSIKISRETTQPTEWPMLEINRVRNFE